MPLVNKMNYWQKGKDPRQVMSEIQTVEAPKTMLILKSHSAALGAVEIFLRNRGWKIYSTANLKEALVQIVSQKPSYVLISVDHPNKKVRALPKLLSQAFPIATIVFAENQSSISYKVLNDSATEYRVFPPVTGPAIERCVNKYLKDQQTRSTVQSAHETFRSENGDNGNGSISIKGGGDNHFSMRGEITTSSFGDESATSRLLSQLLGEEAAISQNTPHKADNNLVFAQTLEEDSNSQAAQSYISGSQTGTHPQDDLRSPYLSEKGENSEEVQSGQNGFGKTYVQKGSAGNIGTYISPNEDPGDFGSAKNEALKGTLGSAKQENPTGDATWEGRGGRAQDGLGSREYRRNHNTTGWAPTEADSRTQHIKERRARSDANDTLIAKGTQKSLEESVDVGGGIIVAKLEESTSAACIVVESARFSGYLVAVMGNNRKFDKTFIETIKQRLFKFLKANGEDVSDNDAMDVKIKQVDFEPWALEYADFLRKSVHQGHEVAMAFFPRSPIKTLLEESDHQDMAKIQLMDLQGDRQVEFDLYVYLPSNNKYVLYTPKGGVFYNKQMDRLKKQGVTHMHIQKAAVQEVSKYHAQNYLNGMVEDFEQKQENDGKTKIAS